MRTVLLDYSIVKKKEQKYEFHYDHKEGLNVVKRNSMEMPFIDSPDKMVCLMSKTEAARESDDYLDTALDLLTKTFSQMESDE